MNHVTLIALEKALATSLAIPLEILSSADVIKHIRSRGREKLVIEVASQDGKSLPLTGGLVIEPTTRLQDIKRTDLIFIPALWGNPNTAVRKHIPIVTWLKQQFQQGAIICSVGTGSYFLAEAGLLDNQYATTHWYYFNDFEKRYPKVKLQRKRFVTHAHHRIFCTGSINAERDILIYFVDRFFGAELANEVSRHFTHELNRSYESLLLTKDQEDIHHDEEIIKIQEWFHLNYSKEVKLKEIAQDFGMSVRSLNRRFKQATDKPPKQYLQEIRIDQAMELLKHTNLSILEIAFRVGYQDAGYFAGLFKKRHSVSPNDYRHLVRNKLFNVEVDVSEP